MISLVKLSPKVKVVVAITSPKACEPVTPSAEYPAKPPNCSPDSISISAETSASESSVLKILKVAVELTTPSACEPVITPSE